MTVVAVASIVSSVIRRCRIRAASAGRVRRAVPGDANSACWPLAVSARAPASSLACCRISTAQACRAAGVSGGLSVSGGPSADAVGLRHSVPGLFNSCRKTPACLYGK